MGLTSLAISLSLRLPKIDEFDNYLFIGPHPDDIEIGAGATIAKLVAKGKHVSFLICTDGRFGDGSSNGITGEALADLRRRESVEAASVLGVSDVHFLNLTDGAGYSREELLQKLAEKITEIQPDIVFAPDPMSRSEAHPDHLMVGNGVKELACMAPYAGVMNNKYGVDGAKVMAVAFYMTTRINRRFKTSGMIGKQFEALSCHKSQYPEGSSELSALKLYLKLRSFENGLKCFSSAGEGFFILGQTHMHCLPETGR